MVTTPPFNRLVLASHNQGKIAELATMLAPFGVHVLSAYDLDLPEVAEDRDTFSGNAAKKAQEICAATNLPTLADDSGLCVDALGGAPGVLTARYSRTYERLMIEIAHIPPAQRGAHFVCVLAFALPDGTLKTFEGRADGHIHTTPLGEGGFGYDPVFIPLGETRTFAQMTADEKKAHSHRGKATKLFLDYLENFTSLALKA